MSRNTPSSLGPARVQPELRDGTEPRGSKPTRTSILCVATAHDDVGKYFLTPLFAAGGLPPGSQSEMMQLMKLVPGNLPFPMNSDNVRNVRDTVLREVDFWTEEENMRFCNAIAMDLEKKSSLDWDVICALTLTHISPYPYPASQKSPSYPPKNAYGCVFAFAACPLASHPPAIAPSHALQFHSQLGASHALGGSLPLHPRCVQPVHTDGTQVVRVSTRSCYKASLLNPARVH